jgi:hypothetical protein
VWIDYVPIYSSVAVEDGHLYTLAMPQSRNRTRVSLPKWIVEQLAQLADEQGRTTSDVALEAVIVGLSQRYKCPHCGQPVYTFAGKHVHPAPGAPTE